MTKRILALLVAVAGPVTAQLDLSFTDFKQHLQTDLDESEYMGGLTFVQLQDGTISIAGCAGQPSAAIIPPNLTCPLGTTGFIAQGDVGNNLTGEAIPDGVPDDGSFWSVSSIVPAAVIEPFQLERVAIIAAPPSGVADLLRGSQGDVQAVFDPWDASVVVWYNFLSFPVEEFQVTALGLERTYGVVPITNQWANLAGENMAGEDLPDAADVMANPAVGDPLHAPDIAVGDPLLRIGTIYNGVPPFNFDITVTEEERLAVVPDFMEDELARHYYDIPWGAYLFEFPALDDPYNEQVLGVSLLVSPDIYPGRGHVPQGWRMINEEWSGGALEVDPRVFYDFEWFGINSTNTVLSDDLYLSMWANQWVGLDGLTNRTLDLPDPADVMPNPPLLTPGNIPDIPDGDPQLRENVIVFPPYPIETPEGDREAFLIGVFDGNYELGPFFFRPGDSARGRLNFQRNLEGGNATRDTTQRYLDFDIHFVDTYDGFSFFSAPLIVGGFPIGTRTSDREPHLDFDGDGSTNLEEFAFQTNVADASSMPTFAFEGVDLGSGAGSCTATVMKRPDVGASLVYEFMYSTDLETWNTIYPTDPNWEVVEDETMLMVTNIVSGVDPSCYLRVAVREGGY